MRLYLEDIVRGYDYPKIECREILPSGEDIFVGVCKYINGELISVDNDTYSLKQVVEKYNINEDGSLTIWY